ncbi:hypothetical protein ACPPVT_22200 [Angustibacter sp. McL0619]|uniref:hypothetical protein n=1 Tax=Angustibacter sp. McL0619 TaxID=3415676 RepID=UPI003CE94363
MKKVIKGAAVFVAGVGLVVATPSIASASDQSWQVSSGGSVRGTASFDDAANRVSVHDSQGDSGIVVVDIWRVGNKGGTHVRCKAGHDGEGGLGVNNNCPLIWVEDTNLAGELCWKVGTSSDNRACSAVKEFFS